jgi:DNA-binding transcriptional ArsR family regulator
MPISADRAERTAELFRVLANPRRLKILWALEGRELSVGQIAEEIGASLQCTSQHLRLMREHGILCARRQGQTVFYRVEGPSRQANRSWLDVPLPLREQDMPLPASQTVDQGDLS